MEKEEVLRKVQSKKALVGEMEKSKFFTASNIALLSSGIFAVALIVVLFAIKQNVGAFAITSICYLWASIFYTLQYFVAKRPWQVLIGSVLDGLAFIASFTFFIIFIVKGW